MAKEMLNQLQEAVSEDLKCYGQVLKKWRLEKSLSINHLHALIKLSNDAIDRLESGYPTSDTNLLLVLKFYGKTIMDLELAAQRQKIVNELDRKISQSDFADDIRLTINNGKEEINMYASKKKLL